MINLLSFCLSVHYGFTEVIYFTLFSLTEVIYFMYRIFTSRLFLKNGERCCFRVRPYPPSLRLFRLIFCLLLKLAF